VSVLKKAIEAVDPAPDKRSDLTAMLGLITELAEQKVKQFSLEINASLGNAGTPENRTLPVTAIVSSHTEYRAFVRSDARLIPDVVTAAVQSFFGGDAASVVEGVKSLVITAVDGILGGGEATQGEKSVYFIGVENFAIVRYDVRFWSRTITAKGLSQHIESVLAVAAFKSSVDVQKLDFNTFMLFYGEQLKKLGMPDDEAAQLLTRAQEAFTRLGGSLAADGGIETTETDLPYPGTLY
jgi:hypothetical protein